LPGRQAPATVAAMPRRNTILAIAFLVAACAPTASERGTPTPTGSPPAQSPRPALALGDEPLEPCAIGTGPRIQALCGTLTMPEDPASPAGRTIDLRVGVIPASVGPAEPDPVFMLAGGPGGAAVDGLTWTALTFGGIHATRDIVLVDQRGTGGSNAMLLDPLRDISKLAAVDADAVAHDWVTTQLGRFDADPAFYTTSIAMDDLDAVRDALGYERINLWGGSYGATAAQYYIRQHGDRVRSVVLDGATLLEVPVFERLAPNSQAALETLFARCASDASCAGAYPDLAGAFEATMASLQRAPVTVAAIDPATGEPGVITAVDFAGAVHSGLIDSQYSAVLPWFIDAAADGRWEEAIAAAKAIGGGDPLDDAMPLMSAIIRCSEAWARYDPAEVARVGAGSYYLEAQLANANLQATMCRSAPRGVVPSDDDAPATSDVPVLFTVGSADPQDPPANIATAADRFPNSSIVIAEGHGHTVSHLGCLPSVVDAFVAAGSVDGLDTSCVTDGVPLPPFRLP
jgi:pimeloyl-ACP methyl ester carboxylesterase